MTLVRYLNTASAGNVRAKAVFALFPAIILASCSDLPGGQVAATVNGEEITFQEINAELRSLRLAEDVDERAAQNLALDRLVERRVLAQQARAEGIDRTPEFLLRERQLRDALLVRMLDAQTRADIAVPDDQAAGRFINENPEMFAQRQVLTVEQVRFPWPGSASRLASLSSAATLDEVATKLRAMDIGFQRGMVELDPVDLGSRRFAELASLPNGQPFVLQDGGTVTIGTVVGSRREPRTGEQAGPIATATLRERQYDRAIETRNERLRKAANIEYGEGFGPPGEETEEAE